MTLGNWNGRDSRVLKKSVKCIAWFMRLIPLKTWLPRFLYLSFLPSEVLGRNTWYCVSVFTVCIYWGNLSPVFSWNSFWNLLWTLSLASQAEALGDFAPDIFWAAKRAGWIEQGFPILVHSSSPTRLSTAAFHSDSNTLKANVTLQTINY